MTPEQVENLEKLCLLVEEALAGKQEAEVPVEWDLQGEVEPVIEMWRRKGWQVVSEVRRGETVLLFWKQQEFLRCPTTPGY